MVEARPWDRWGRRDRTAAAAAATAAALAAEQAAEHPTPAASSSATPAPARPALEVEAAGLTVLRLRWGSRSGRRAGSRARLIVRRLVGSPVLLARTAVLSAAFGLTCRTWSTCNVPIGMHEEAGNHSRKGDPKGDPKVEAGCLANDAYCRADYDALNTRKDLWVPALMAMGTRLGASELRISNESLRSYVEESLELMPQNPYHNGAHVFDVTQFMYTMLWRTSVVHVLEPSARFATFIAALSHDLEHTGTSNQILVAEGHNYLSEMTGDVGPLESHHANVAVSMLRRHGVLSRLPRPEAESVRRMIRDLIHATDIGIHGQVMSDFKDAHGDWDELDPVAFFRTPDSVSKMLAVMMKVADVCHNARPTFEVLRQWRMRIYREFYAEGDRDRAAGRPLEPLHDRETNDIIKSTGVFIRHYVGTTVNELAEFLEHCGGAGVMPNALGWVKDPLGKNYVRLKKIDLGTTLQVHIPLTAFALGAALCILSSFRECLLGLARGESLAESMRRTASTGQMSHSLDMTSLGRRDPARYSSAGSERGSRVDPARFSSERSSTRPRVARAAPGRHDSAEVPGVLRGGLRVLDDELRGAGAEGGGRRNGRNVEDSVDRLIGDARRAGHQEASYEVVLADAGERGPDYLVVAGMMLLFGGATSGLIFCGKIVLSTAIVSDELDFKGIRAPFLFGAIHQLMVFFCFIVWAIYCRLTHSRDGPSPMSSRRHLLVMALFSLSHALNVGLNNLSISLLPISLNLVIRSCFPLSTILADVVYKTYDPKFDAKTSGYHVGNKEKTCIIIAVSCTLLAIIAQSYGGSHSTQPHLHIGMMAGAVSILSGTLNQWISSSLGSDREEFREMRSVDVMFYRSLPTAVLLMLPTFLSPHHVWPGMKPMTDWEVVRKVLKIRPSMMRLAVVFGLAATANNIVSKNLEKRLTERSALQITNLLSRGAAGVLSVLYGVESLPSGWWQVLMVVATMGNIISWSLFARHGQGNTTVGGVSPADYARDHGSKRIKRRPGRRATSILQLDRFLSQHAQL